jgi:PleD family two-component response regulator
VASSAAEPAPKTADATPSLHEELKKLQVEWAAMQRELEIARARIAQLERLADEDSLAPIANRRAFVRELSRMIAFTRRYGPPSSVSILTSTA